jgi:hypothetical protein
LIDTEPGNMSGPTRQGFDDRIGNNSDTFNQVFGTDPDTGFQTIEKLDSPRLGIVPIVENSNGTNSWPNGKKQVRILGYMLVYIGKTDTAGNPPYTNNGKSVWVTPVRPILPENFPDGSFTDYNANIQAPVVYRLTE